MGADVILLLVNDSESCGQARRIPARNKNESFCVVHYDCATGNYSFGHEIGHLLGARHAYIQDDNGSYNHGFVHHENGVYYWRTIMVTNFKLLNMLRIRRWSNPYKTYNSVATGTADRENNVRMLNSRRWKVSGFRTPPPPPFTVSISGPTHAPCAIGTWRASVSNGSSPYSYQWYFKWDCSGEPPNKIPCDTWITVGSNSSTYQMFLCGGNAVIRVVVTDKNDNTTSDDHYVFGAESRTYKTNDDVDGNDNKNSIQNNFSLEQNFPNPFNPTTEIKFSLPEISNLKLTIINSIGEAVKTLTQGSFSAGVHCITWDGRNDSGGVAASGLYFYLLTAKGVSGKEYKYVMRMMFTK